MNHFHEKHIGEAATMLNPDAQNSVFLICDHASNNIPPEFGNLGVGPADRQDHVAWDIGTADVTRVLSKELNARAVIGEISRLVVDYNRQPDAPDVIAEVTHGVVVPGNIGLDSQQRKDRFQRFYNPYHKAIDQQLRTPASRPDSPAPGRSPHGHAQLPAWPAPPQRPPVSVTRWPARNH